MTTTSRCSPSEINSSIDRFNRALGLLKVFTCPDRQFLTEVFAEAMRIAGQGEKVLIAQMMKGGINQGPQNPSNLVENLDWVRCSSCICTERKDIDESQKAAALELWAFVKSSIVQKTYELVILDEIGLSISMEIINEAEVFEVLASRPSKIDLIITGKYIPDSIIDLADQVTRFKNLRI